MARSLNSEEAAIFKEDQLPGEQFSAFVNDFKEGLLKHEEEGSEMTPEAEFWLCGRFPGS
jgi:hypothetical protein